MVAALAGIDCFVACETVLICEAVFGLGSVCLRESVGGSAVRQYCDVYVVRLVVLSMVRLSA